VKKETDFHSPNFKIFPLSMLHQDLPTKTMPTNLLQIRGTYKLMTPKE
jgi:hypothetical protein